MEGNVRQTPQCAKLLAMTAVEFLSIVCLAWSKKSALDMQTVN